ncbi:MAG: hypothetical protein JW712_07100 [Dehalococcoidales bacterium]|nr:hypothetical protein [Dehalococcoidales bacterium]
MAQTNTGLDEKIAGMLSYLVLWPSGIIFLILEPNNKYVRFHALQSIIVFGAISIAMMIFSWIPVFSVIIYIVGGVLMFALWVLLLIKSSQGDRYKVRWAGDLAEKLNGETA